MAELQSRGSDIQIGRVLAEDDDFMTIEVVKNPNRQLIVNDGDWFLSFVFVRNTAPDGAPANAETWVPWHDGT